MPTTIDLLHKSEKLTISNFGFWILDFGLRDLGLLQEVLSLDFLQKSGTGNRKQGTEADKTEHLQEVFWIRGLPT
jgi:hypothetical protein